MKKILFSLLSLLVCAQSINAQRIEVYKDGVLREGFESTAAEIIEVKFREHREYVDLGLKSGTLWATCNVGAEKPEDYGYHFAWGETQGYSSAGKIGRSFEWETYKWISPTWKSTTVGFYLEKYTIADGSLTRGWYRSGTFIGDGKSTLEPEDDAATVIWGGSWCMPTAAQIDELINPEYTTTKWSSQNGVNGLLITSKKNGKTLFLPAAGYRNGYDLISSGSTGSYLSCDLSSYTEYACRLQFDLNSVSRSTCERRWGYSVRAVRSSYKKGSASL